MHDFGKIGRIERLSLRNIWKHEALNFTTWLEENIDVLNDILDLDLTNVEREKTAGTFNIDLVAEDEQGLPVIIENQLEKSNHDHLGKVLTYLTAMEAKTAIWIVADPRPEHVNAINWLNESSAASFYMLKLEGVRIGESLPAPLLTLIVGPSEEARQAGSAKKEIAERYQIRKRFWTQLLEKAKGKTKLHANISPNEFSWIGTSAGHKGLSFNYNVKQHATMAELYIDTGKDGYNENKAIFDQLHASKDKIEAEFGDRLQWKSLEGKRACRICYPINHGGYRDEEEKWPEIQDKTIDAMISLEKALKPHIRKLNSLA